MEVDAAPGDGDGAEERLRAELDLLMAIYPDAVAFSPKGRELTYSHEAAKLLLRLPDAYPVAEKPELVSATGPDRRDLRSATKAAFVYLDLANGEVLDALILAFQDLLSSQAPASRDDSPAPHLSATRDAQPKCRTVVIWLHHLLNTNKRKLALNPSLPSPDMLGITRPGYPGVLVFSGPKPAVDAHVSELRSQRWQAFQIRYDSDDPWAFSHSAGIAEVESISDVAQAITDTVQRELFLSSLGVK
ncbi:hypothetical protein GGR56DRAFT_673435 [Xylariaceae sp. FL0804]|nr:hypothetical protein GGR56DRAFT_673435 [Xylariaceae sp. FL0804]